MNKYFQQAMDLARRTGDRLIVFDSAKNEKPVVVMDIDSYEEMVDEDDWQVPDMWDFDDEDDLTDMDNLDRIKSEIPDWEKVGPEPELDMYSPAADLDDYEIDPASLPDFETLHDPEFGFDTGFDPDAGSGRRRKRPNWRIPKDRKAAAEEVIEDEDPQYLEMI